MYFSFFIRFCSVLENNQYTITFDPNGGSEVAAITADYGSLLTLPTPTREGAYFLGWEDLTNPWRCPQATVSVRGTRACRCTADCRGTRTDFRTREDARLESEADPTPEPVGIYSGASA